MTSRMNALEGFSSTWFSLILFPGMTGKIYSSRSYSSSQAIYSRDTYPAGSSIVSVSSDSWYSWNSSSCSSSLFFIHSCTIASRLLCQAPRCCCHTLLFLVTLSTCVITCFLVPWSFFSSLCLLLFLFQLFNQGLCQLVSISACLGRVCYLQRPSLTSLICLT